MAYSIGVDLGGTNIAVGIVDARGDLLKKISVPTGSAHDYKILIEKIAAAVEQVTAESGLDMQKIRSVGAGIPGTVDPSGRAVIFAPNIQWEDVPFSDILEKRLGLPVQIENDAECAALAEGVCGGAKGCGSAVMLTFGTGVGGGFLMDGKLFKGCRRIGTEPGHMTLVFGGEKCGCGRLGCYEAYASASALKRQTARAMEENPQSLMWALCGGTTARVSGKTAFAAARAGDETGARVVDQYISYMAAGISSIINIFWPEIVLVGGGISGEGDDLLIPLNKKLKEFCYGNGKVPVPPVVSALLKNDAGIIGAALLGHDRTI